MHRQRDDRTSMNPRLSVSRDVGRRSALRLGVAGALALAAFPVLPVRSATLNAPKRRLAFVNLHTGEKLDAVYWSGGQYRPDAAARINHILRDFRTGELHPIDFGLLDVLHDLRLRLRARAPFEIISGYRSPATNAKLASENGGVAKRSFHMQGMAIDVRLPDRGLKLVRDTAIDMQRGGVGYYRRSDFVHLDVGPIRAW